MSIKKTMTQRIAELEAEVERLKGYNENLLTANTALSNELLEAKSEAYREFAERLVDIAVGNWCHKVDVATITNTLKELTEKNDFKE